MRVQNGPNRKERTFFCNYFIFRRFYFNLRNSYKELIWWPNHPNVHIHTLEYYLRCYFPVSIPKLGGKIKILNYASENLTKRCRDIANQFQIRTSTTATVLWDSKNVEKNINFSKVIVNWTIYGNIWDIVQVLWQVLWGRDLRISVNTARRSIKNKRKLEWKFYGQFYCFQWVVGKRRSCWDYLHPRQLLIYSN